MKEQLKRYGISLIASFGIFAILSFYLFLRRGYYDLFIANKALAGTAFVLLAFVLLVGLLARYFVRFDGWLIYRKEIGIVAFVFALAHGVVSFLIPQFNLFSWAALANVNLWLGGLALLILLFLTVISGNWAIRKFGGQKWWFFQQWGARLALILVLYHVFLMKYGGWADWFIHGGSKTLARPYLPPLSLFSFLPAIFVVVVRLGEFFGPKIGKVIFFASLSLLAAAYLISFLWWLV